MTQLNITELKRRAVEALEQSVNYRGLNEVGREAATKRAQVYALLAIADAINRIG